MSDNVQEIHASRGETDLVVMRLKASERRFNAALASATVTMALVGIDNVRTYHVLSADTVLFDGRREVSLSVGATGTINPPAGTYQPEALVIIPSTGQRMSVDAENCGVVVID